MDEKHGTIFPMKFLHRPLKQFIVNQKFGQNNACVDNATSRNVITCDGNNPPAGYRSLYGSAGHLGVDLAAYHGMEVYCILDGVVDSIDTELRSGLDVRIVSEYGGKKYRHIYEHLMGYQPKIGDRVRVGQLVGWADNCFDKETEVLTESGWKHFIDIESADKVATINMETREIEFQRPIKYTKRYEQTMYLHKNKTTDFCVSGDHNILVERGWRRKRLQLTKLNELTLKHSRAPLILSGTWTGADVEDFYLPAFSFKRDRWGTISNKEPLKIKMDDWLAFLGIFLSDGNMAQKERNRVNIAQSKPENIKKIHDLLCKLPFNYWAYSRKQGKNDLVIFNISNNQLYDYLAPTLKGANRNVPTFLKELSARQIQIFLDWFFLGDGHQRERNGGREKTYYPGLSKPIADSLQEFIIKTGFGSRITRRGICYEVKHRFSENSYFDPDCVEEIAYNDYAYCVSVPNKTLLTRRNGVAIFLGNSGYSSGDHLHLQFEEWDGNAWIPIDPMLYMSEKFAKDILLIEDKIKYIQEQIALITDRFADWLRRR